MALDLNPMSTLNNFKATLTSPIGWILILICAVYIYLRVTGRIGSAFGRVLGQGGGGSSSGGNKQRPDYILKR